MYRVDAIRWRITYFGNIRYKVIETYYFRSLIMADAKAEEIQSRGMNYSMSLEGSTDPPANEPELD
jgi:hypothetical protein